MERFWKTTLTLCLLYLAAAMIIRPVSCVSAAKSAVTLCLDVVIPSLFPFFICSNLFISLGLANMLSRRLSRLMRPLFGVPGCGALAAVLGVVSGYPIGASCAAGLYTSGSCTKTEAERLLTFCSNSGPLFVLGAVGIGMLHNQRLGILLYIAHITAAFLTGILFRHYGKSASSSAPAALPVDPDGKTAVFAIGTAVADAVDSILKICGFVIFFAVVTAALPKQPMLPFLYGLLEITGGIRELLNTGTLLGNFMLPVISFFLALSGLSVLLQTAGIILPAGLSLKPYILGKCTQAILAFGLTILLLHFFPVSAPAFADASVPIFIPTTRMLLAGALVGIVFSAIAIGVLWSVVLLWEWLERRREKKENGR